MEIMIITTRNVLEEALNSARQIGAGEDIEGLAAALDATLLGRVEEAWDAIETSLRNGFRYGKEKAQTQLNEAVQQVEHLIAGAGSRSREMQDIFIARLRMFNHKFTQGALTQFPIEVEVGGKAYTLSTLKFTQKLVLSGSIQLSLTRVFELVSSGEIVIAADYTDISRPKSDQSV